MIIVIRCCKTLNFKKLTQIYRIWRMFLELTCSIAASTRALSKRVVQNLFVLVMALISNLPSN